MKILQPLLHTLFYLMVAGYAMLALLLIVNATGSVFRGLLGCRHSHMSRPYPVNDEPYRTCLECGSRLALKQA